MEVKTFVFQADSEIVNSIFDERSNYIIEYENSNPNNLCVIYFSSNNIYYPNTEATFENEIVKKNRFEWYGSRISAYKHIFIRDIKKQWYLSGINSKQNSPARLLEILKDETTGYRVMTVGSSAGGFAAMIYGQLLFAERTYTFNGQFEINSLLKTSNENIDPLIFRYKDDLTLRPYYDAKPFIVNPETIFYFHSTQFPWDVEQRKYVSDLEIKTISFITKRHGIPFLKANLPCVLHMSNNELLTYTGKKWHPLIFSIKTIGYSKTFFELIKIFTSILKKYSFKIIKN